MQVGGSEAGTWQTLAAGALPPASIAAQCVGLQAVAPSSPHLPC